MNIFNAAIIRRLPGGMLALVCAAPLASAQMDIATGELIDAAVAQGMRDQPVPGVALLIARDGKPIYMKGYGKADLENAVPVTAETAFQSGSVGKMFTATAVVQLARAGKLSLDDALPKYFPQAPQSWQRITVRQLLQHRSGIPDYEDSFDLKREYTDEDLVAAFAKPPLDFEPGTRYSYSNSGYVLLGQIVKAASGQFYGDYLAERVFRPLDMRSTSVNDIDAIVPHRARGYELKNGVLANDDWVSRALSVTADGSLLFSIVDLAKWDAALYGDAVLPQDALNDTFSGGPFPDGTQPTTSYGFGWVTSDVRGHRLVSHGGRWQGFSTFLARFVDDGVTVAVLTNLATTNGRAIALKVAAAIDPAFAPYEPIKDEAPRTSQRDRETVFAYLREGAMPRVLRDDEQARRYRQRLRDEVGVLADSATFDLVEMRGNDLRRYALRAEGVDLLVDVRTNDRRGRAIRFATR